MKSIASKAKYLILLLIISLSFAQNNKEFRATWVITWEHDCDSTKIKQILDRHEKANMNAVLFQVRQSGTAYYNSSYEPWGHYANYQNPGFDPLAFAVKEAHKRGLELHAWFNTFQASSTVQGAPAQENPEWVCRDGNNNPMPQSKALSPGLDTVRSYTRQVAMEIVRNYDIDGIHLDYIR
ncbi:MAG TPA: family 10 glycosylhydrolase, partial [bacterium]|nr:family 10 glycosylhydrolase [bacterium]